MFVLIFVFLVLLAASSSSAQPGFPRYVQGRWVLADEQPLFDDTDEQLQPAEDTEWFNNPLEVVQWVTPMDQNLQTTPDSSALNAQELDKVTETAAWKVVLVVGILLVSLVGSVSMAYYYCVWRGGRFHYRHQMDGCS